MALYFFQLNQDKAHEMVNKKHDIARQTTDLEAIYHKYDGAEGKFDKKEKNYKKDLYDLIEYVKWITDETRITIIGCTSEPHEGSKKEFKKFFDRSIYFPFPDYTTRRLMWKVFIENAGGKIQAGFQLSTLAHISEGYSAGSIKKTCESVLTKFRRERLD